MKNIRIVGLWLLTVLIGSIIFATGIMLFDSGHFRADGWLWLIFVSILASGAFSIPAIIAFVVGNNHYKNKLGTGEEYRRSMYKFHLVVGLIYLFIASAFGLLEGEIQTILALLVLFVCYLPAGMILWYFGFKNVTESVTKANPEILDETQQFSSSE